MPIERIMPDAFPSSDRIEALKELFPEAFADGAINWSTLRDLASSATSEDEEESSEHFGLFWPGKREARRLAGKPAEGTLIPCPGEGVDEETTSNIFIEGENLEVLKLLRKSYKGMVKMIYIDPPYNTGNDFVYDDNFTEPLEDYLCRTGQIDGEGRPLTTNKKSDGRFHSKWLSMMYPRLRLARDLLRDDGVIFVSIDDNEVQHLRMLMNEVFGEENFVASLVWDGGRKNDSKKISVGHEYIMIFEKKNIEVTFHEDNSLWRERKEGIDEIYSVYNKSAIIRGSNWEMVSCDLQKWYKALRIDHPAKAHEHYRYADSKGVYFASDLSGPDDGRKNRPRYIVYHPITQKPVPIPSRGWRWEEPRMVEEIKKKRVHFGKDESSIPNGKVYLKENEYQAPSSVFYKDRRSGSNLLRSILEAKVFDFPKDLSIIKRLCLLVSRSGDIVLDFFAGSATTAHAVLDLNNEDGGNRKFILVQMPEATPADSEAAKAGYQTIAEIGKERIRRVIKKIKAEKAQELTAADDVPDLGFKVYKLARSNFKLWREYRGEDIAVVESLFEEAVTPLAEEWKKQPEALFTEILLLEGYPLDSSVKLRIEFADNLIREVSCPQHEKRLLVCLDDQIAPGTVRALELSSDEIFVCLDSAIDDSTKARLDDKGMIKTI